MGFPWEKLLISQKLFKLKLRVVNSIVTVSKKKIVELGSIFLFFAFLYWSISPYLSIETLQTQTFWLQDFIEHNLIFSSILFIFICAIVVNSPFPIAAFVKFSSGFFFGFLGGFLLSVIGTLVGAFLGYMVSKHLFFNSFQKKFASHHKKFSKEVETNGFYYILTLRLILIMPYFLINILGGISNVSLKKFLQATALGVIPASLFYAYFGTQISQVTSFNDFFTLEIILLSIALVLIGIFPLVYKKLIEKN